MSFRAGVVVALGLAFGMPGCGGGPKLVPVSGNVTLNGKPLRDAEIMFVPTDANKQGIAGRDTTGPEGNYRVMCNGRAGLVAGPYKVVISRSTVDTTKVAPVFKDDPYMAKLVMEGPEAELSNRPTPAVQKPSEIKGEFNSEVPAEGAVLDFDVKAEVAKSG
jgi:hypothetical protein